MVGALVVGAVVLGACAEDGPPTIPETAASPDIVVTATDSLRFEPNTFTLPAGQQVTLVLSADSGVEHDFVVENAAAVGMAEADDAAHGAEDGGSGATASDLHVAHVDPGQTTTATIQFNEPGIYAVYCSIPGHREAGMIATLTVVDGA